MKEYLTEQSLQDILTLIYNKEFIRDKKVPNSNILNRPDYRNDELMIIVEFDGYGHYTNPQIIINDIKKDNCYKDMGYTIIRIPYYVQISTETIKHLFNKDIEYIQTYKHGFIDKKVIYPAQFCELGVIKLLEDLERFSFIQDEIKESIITNNKDINILLPPSIQYLF